MVMLMLVRLAMLVVVVRGFIVPGRLARRPGRITVFVMPWLGIAVMIVMFAAA